MVLIGKTVRNRCCSRSCNSLFLYSTVLYGKGYKSYSGWSQKTCHYWVLRTTSGERSGEG